MPPKKKRRKVEVGGSNPSEEEKRTDFIINSTLDEDDVQEILQKNEMGELKKHMSRGQRKRFKAFEKKVEKKNLVEKIKFDFDVIEEEDESIPKSRSLLSMEEGDTVDERYFMNMKDLELSLDQLQKNLNKRPQKKKKKKKNDLRNLLSDELQHFNNVLSNEAFQNDPSQAISEHLDNKIQLENMKLGIIDNDRNDQIVPPPEYMSTPSNQIVPPPTMNMSRNFVRNQQLKNGKKDWKRFRRNRKKGKKKKLNRRTGKKRKRGE